MKKIGITGNIASGKSTVEKLIADKGFSIIDADEICHDAIENNEKIINNIKIIFREFDILNDDKSISRKKLGEIVFKNGEYRKKLESIIHPYVNKKIEEFIENHRNENLIFISVPLLFEAKMEAMFDRIILITADEKIRLERLIKRNNFNHEHALARIKSQMPQDEKTKLADFVIDNNSNIETLEKNTENQCMDKLCYRYCRPIFSLPSRRGTVHNRQR